MDPAGTELLSLLASPEAKSLRTQFEQSRDRDRRKCTLTYDELVTLHAKNESVEAIAALSGEHRQSVHWRYDRYIAPLLGPLSDITAEAHRLKKQQEQAARETSTPLAREIHKLLQTTRYRELPVTNPLGDLVVIGKKRCLVKRRQTVWYANNTPTYPYALFQANYRPLTKADVCLCLVRIPGFPPQKYIIPTSMLLKQFRSKEGVLSLYIPLRKKMKVGPKAALDFKKYKNAWKYMQQSLSPEDSSAK